MYRMKMEYWRWANEDEDAAANDYDSRTAEDKVHNIIDDKSDVAVK